MATSKLTVEIDAETSKAQQKLREAVGSAAVDIGGGPGGGGLGASTDKAARSLDKLDKSAQSFDSRLVSVTRAMAGMAVGMATSYASRYFEEGSTARKAMEYGGAAISGATAGATAGATLGPWGAVAGGVAGLATGVGKTYLEKDAAKTERLAEFEKSEKIFESLAAWNEKVRSLSESLDVGEIKTILDNLKASEGKVVGWTRDAIEGERYTEAGDHQRALADIRRRQEQMQALLREAEKPKEGGPAFRASTSAVDALSRIGGNFGGGVDLSRDQLQTSKDQLNVLKSIEQKTGRGNVAWQ